MNHYVYIIYSAKCDVYYKGYTLQPQERIIRHNDNQSKYTSNKGPWEIVCLLEFETKKEALIEEKRIKKLNRKSLEKLIKINN